MAEIDPGMLEFYKALSAESPPESANWPLDEQRAGWNAVCAKFRAPIPEGIAVEDRVLGGVPCQVFRPRGEGVRPGVIYFHGGGWVLGGPQTHGDMCAEMAAGAGCTVVLVDYRLAPEHTHPAQLQDSIAVLRWLRAHGAEIGVDPAHIVAAGDSAGGQMSAGLALWLRDHGEAQVDAMVAIYPVFGNDTDTASAIRNADAPCLTRDEMIYFIASFLGPKGGPNWSDPYAAPLLGDLTGLPPAFVAVAGHDPLYDDGIAFHERMLAAGNACELRVEPALAHSYMRARHHSAVAMDGFRAIVAAVRAFTRS